MQTHAFVVSFVVSFVVLGLQVVMDAVKEWRPEGPGPVRQSLLVINGIDIGASSVIITQLGTPRLFEFKIFPVFQFYL